MIITVITMRMMQVAIVKVIGVAIMFDGCVTTASLVLMVVFFVDLILAGHRVLLNSKEVRGRLALDAFLPPSKVSHSNTNARSIYHISWIFISLSFNLARIRESDSVVSVGEIKGESDREVNGSLPTDQPQHSSRGRSHCATAAKPPQTSPVPPSETPNPCPSP